MTRRFLAGLFLAALIAALSWLALTPVNKPPPVTGISAVSGSPVIIGSQENIKLLTPKGGFNIVTKIDTGADLTSIDNTLARSLGLEPTGKTTIIITEERREVRNTTKLTFIMANRQITTTATLADRTGFSTSMIIGKKDLAGFLVDASREFLTKPETPSDLPLPNSSNTGIFGGDSEPGLARVLIVIPIMGTVIVLVRLLVGIRTFGIFAPVVVALSLLDLNILPGILIYALLVTTGIGTKLLILNRLKLPTIAELSFIIFVLVLVLFGVSALPFDFIPSLGDVFFRLVITTFIIEQSSRVAEEHRIIDVLPMLVATFATAIGLAYYGAFLLEQPAAVLWGFFAVSVFGIIITGNYLGLRLTELIRFKFLRKSHVHK
ncbi:MAG: hypothetical protein HY529_05770 [Chloroflexi bacterium]|nr:hypothetical protein [Chloroflexota bacterium]